MIVKRRLPFAILLLVTLAACGAPTARSSAGDVMLRWEPALYPRWAPFPLTPFPEFTPAPIFGDASGQPPPTPALPPGVTIPARPYARQDDPDYRIALLGEGQLGPYTVRHWRDTSMQPDVVTISAGAHIFVQLEDERQWVRLAGQDITGEGHPDVVVSSWKPVPLFAYTTDIYDLGPTITHVLHLHPITCGDALFGDGCPCGGMFQDLDRDGLPEVITCDEAFHRRWAFPTRIYDCAPQQLVILQYDAGRGYVPASHRFPDLYAPRLAWLRKEATRATTEPGTPGQGPPCAVAGLLLNLLYIGQPDKAWTELDQGYDALDKALWWVETLRILSGSQYYEPAGHFPDVPLPDYYLLQSTAGCDSPRGDVAILQEGQAPCDPVAPQWDELWLAALLRQAGLLDEHEGLDPRVVDCPAACGMGVFRFGEFPTRAGTLWLDAASGFPGEVYRVYLDGTESAHLRLTGDLTWEPLSP